MKELLEQLTAKRDLTSEQARELLLSLAPLAIPEGLAAAILVALRAKGESAAEVAGLATGMLQQAVDPELDPAIVGEAIDVVGTGGDGSNSYNISTGGALLAAACGLPVVKHGNRSVSSACGAADVLEKLGLPMPLDARAARRCLEDTKFTFLFAPHYHPTTGALVKVRRDLGVRTVFNILGPLTNPARPPFRLLGAFSRRTAELMAHALVEIGVTRAFVVCSPRAEAAGGGGEVNGEAGGDVMGWDEASPMGPFELWDVQNGSVTKSVRDPLDYGIARCEETSLRGGDAAFNAAALRQVMCGRGGGEKLKPLADAMMLTAGLGLEVTGRAATLAGGIAHAREALYTNAAPALVHRLELFGELHRAGIRADSAGGGACHA